MTRGPLALEPDLDLGPELDEEIFPGLRVIRAQVARHEWDSVASQIVDGTVDHTSAQAHLEHAEWSAPRLYVQDGQSEAHKVVRSARRPIYGIASQLSAPPLPESQGIWVRGGSPKPIENQTRDELGGRATFANWPLSLLGIDWHGGTEHPPPQSFVIGKARGGIWIADTLPDRKHDLIKIVLAWEEEIADPLSCSILFRSERDGALLLASQWRISDLPGVQTESDDGKEAREMGWKERTMDVVLPRGPHHTDWGMTLIGPDGSIYDEQPVARRNEQIEVSLQVGDSRPSTTVSGEKRPQPSAAELHRAVVEAQKLEAETRRRAADRRIATAGELREYLRWRFSARAGEMLVLDRYLFDGTESDIEEVVGFLNAFRRPIRALVSKVPKHAPAFLSSEGQIRVRQASPDSFHDRLWIVGESGLLVGTSPNDFLREEDAPAAGDRRRRISPAQRDSRREGQHVFNGGKYIPRPRTRKRRP